MGIETVFPSVHTLLSGSAAILTLMFAFLNFLSPEKGEESEI